MNITNNKTGEYLYKYMPFNQYSLQLLINQEFYLSSPDLLNDPFEGDFIILNWSELYNEESYRLLLDKQKTYSNEWLQKHIRETNLKRWREKESDFQNDLYEYLSGSIKRQFGTTSFSRNCNSIDMWSHYADSHKGFVIVFDYKSLSAYFLEDDIKFCKVEYDSMPEISVNKNNLTIVEPELLLINKLPRWKKEKEVRIISKHWSDSGYENDFSRMIKFPKESILGLIYGSRMTTENLLTIDRLFQTNSLEYKSYYSKKNNKRNKLLFVEMKI